MEERREEREETGEGRSRPESLILCFLIRAAKSTGATSAAVVRRMERRLACERGWGGEGERTCE